MTDRATIRSSHRTVRHAKADYAGELTTGLARVEQIRTLDDLGDVARFLAAALGAPEHQELWRAFRDWLFAIHKRMMGVDEPGLPPPDLSLEDIAMTAEERAAEWPEQFRREGERRGIVRGRREQLRSLAEVRFGTPTAQRLFASLQREDDPQRLDEIAVAVVRCETADELLRQASRPTPSDALPHPRQSRDHAAGAIGTPVGSSTC